MNIASRKMNASARGGVESVRFILYGIPNHAVICLLLHQQKRGVLMLLEIRLRLS
jgi:hypothetical protein